MYGISKEGIINIVSFPQALAIKATIVRSRPSGAFGDTDVYGAQQHAPLLSIMVLIISTFNICKFSHVFDTKLNYLQVSFITV